MEKPYGYAFEALSTLQASGMRTGPRCREGKLPGYNLLVGWALGEKKVGLTSARTISYNTPDFVSLNREIFRAIRYSHVILSERRLRFTCDRGFDDEKLFALGSGWNGLWKRSCGRFLGRWPLRPSSRGEGGGGNTG